MAKVSVKVKVNVGKSKKTLKQKVKQGIKQGMVIARQIFGHIAACLISIGKTMPVVCKFKIVSDRMVGLDHVMCKQFEAYEPLAVNGFKLDRPLNLRTAAEYAVKMITGMFLWPHVTLATVIYKGKRFRANGQTTVMARYSIDDPATAPEVRWVEYEVEDEEGLRQLYSCIDVGLGRTAFDLIRALLAGKAEFKGVTLKDLRKICSGMNKWLNVNRKNRSVGGLTTQDRANLMLTTEYETVQWVLRVVGDNPDPVTWRTPVVTALLTVFSLPKYQKECPTFRFWYNVMHRSGYEDKSAGKLLATYLETHSVKTDQSKGLNQVSDETMIKVCLGYFVAWQNGGPLESIECVDNACPRPVIS